MMKHPLRAHLTFALKLLFWSLLGTLTLGLGVSQLSQETDPQKMWAFIVGVSNYTHAQPLSYGATDAQAFADFLESPRGGGVPRDHISILLEERATRTGIEYEMEQYWDKVQAGDTVYVYIAGHGFVHRRRIGYFLPVDGDPTSPNSTSLNLLALQQGIFFGFEIADTLVLITDMCHSGILADQQNAINQLLLTTFGEADEGKAFLNLVASGRDEPSWEDNRLGHGIFTFTLLEALNGRGIQLEQPRVRASQVVQYVQQEVPARTANQQNPETNESFDPSLTLAFLDRPGPMPVPPEDGTILRLIHARESPFLRAQWVDPENQSIAVKPIPKDADEVAIGPLTPGDLELTLFDEKNQPRKVMLTLQPGENSLDVQRAQVGRLRLEPRPPGARLASLAPVLARGFQPPLQNPVPAPTPNPPPDPSLVLRLEPGTQVYVDDRLMAEVAGAERPLQLRGLGREPLVLRLVYSQEHEQRFRLKLLPGPQWFEPATRQLRPVRQLAPPPAYTAPPAGLPETLHEAYRGFQQALWEQRLIEPAGDSAWDRYFQLQPQLPEPWGEELRGRLVVAMGNQAQRIILQYLSGRDLKWRAEDFDRGAELTSRMRQLFRDDGVYRSQEAFFRGRAEVERKQFAEGRDRLQESVALQPEASHALNAVGLAFWQENRLAEALPPLEQAIELTPYWNYPRITRSLVLLQLRRYDEAEAGFRAALQNNSEDSTAFHGLGQLFFITGRWREAEPELRRALEFDPGNAYAYHTLGQLQLRLQRFGEAEESLRLAIRLEPEEPAFRLTLASLLRQVGRVGEAGAVLADLVEREPESAAVQEAYGQFLGSLNREAEATAAFRKALELAPRNANLRVSYGIFLAGRNRPKDAAEEFRRALKLDPENAFAYSQLAELAFAEQKLDEADKLARKAIESDPRYAPPYRLLGQAAFARRRHDEALELLRKARDLATEAHQKQELEEAVQRIEAAIVDEQLGRVAEAEVGGRPAEAWALLADTLQRAPESRLLRNRILEFQAAHPDSSPPAKLPESILRQVLSGEFWLGLTRADRLWAQGETGAALDQFEAAFSALVGDQLRVLGSTAFNFENEVYGLHEILHRWGLRALEAGQYQRVLDWMGLARERWVYAPVPDYSPTTVDSLMRPEDIPDPQRFEECEVAHHPDRRAHELLAAAWAGLGDVRKASEYLTALEFRSPDLPIRLTMAEALQRSGRPAQVEELLNVALTAPPEAASADRRARAWTLLARAQCESGRCDQAMRTLRRGLEELPGNELVRKAMRELGG